MNLTTLLVPLFAMSALADRIIKPKTPYVELSRPADAAFSSVFQAGVVAWVAFWSIYGQGFAAENLTAISQFGAAYLLVIFVVEPLADLAVLFVAKQLHGVTNNDLFVRPPRHRAAARPGWWRLRRLTGSPPRLLENTRPPTRIQGRDVRCVVSS